MGFIKSIETLELTPNSSDVCPMSDRDTLIFMAFPVGHIKIPADNRMRILIIVSAIILAVIGHRFYRVSKANTQFSVNMDDLNSKLDDMKLENKKLRDLIQREPPKKIADLATKEHTIILNSDQNVVTYDFPYTLRNVKHVELITGIMPKAQYRINEFNNVINDLEIRPGSYTDIISLLMYVNQQLYENGEGIVLMFDSLERNIIAAANTAVTLNLSDSDTLAPVLGYGANTYTFPASSTFDANVITGSLTHFTTLKQSANDTNSTINNYPPDYYTFTSLFANNVPSASWQYLYGDDRVNMKHQMYVDVLMDEVTYFDGTHRLARIFVPEDRDDAEYQSYGRPILRSLNADYIDLDKITFRLKSIVSDTRSNDYQLNGLNYSLQVQITTVDPYLIKY